MNGPLPVPQSRPTPSLTMADLLCRSYQQFASQPAVLTGDTVISYADLGRRATRVAAALHDRGLAPGDRVVLLTANRAEFFDVEHAAFIGGFVRVALSPRLHPKEVAHIVRDSGARAVFVDESWAEHLAGVLADCPGVLIAVGFGSPSAAVKLTYAELLKQAPDGPAEFAPVDAEDIAALLYTSGTTGLPKGAALSHRNWVAMIRNCLVEMPPVDEQDLLLHVAPLSHFSGYMASPCFIRGSANLVVPKFDAAETLQILRDHPVTVLPMVPTMINMLTTAAEEQDVTPTLRAIIYGGSPIAPERLRRASRVFGDVFLQFYGLSETPMPLTSLAQEAHVFDPAESTPERLASAGRRNPFVELKLVKADGIKAGVGEVGEIVVRSDAVMRGYWNKPVETAEMISESGWASTGDLGRMDAEGYIYVVDRKKDMIVTGGYNVYPTEVENAISTLESVAEVAVVGAPDERFGEQIVAVINTRPGYTVSEADIVEVCVQQLASYKKPRRVIFMDELPKTGSGKIQRKQIREPLWAAERRRVGG